VRPSRAQQSEQNQFSGEFTVRSENSWIAAARDGRTRVPGMGLNYRDEMNSTELMVVTVAELQGRTCEGQA
jgi:hypothetical protein